MKGRMLAVALIAFGVAAPGQAQLGGLRKLKDKIDAASKPDAPDMVQGKASLEWTIETTSADFVPRKVEPARGNRPELVQQDFFEDTSVNVRTFRGSAAGVLSLSPQALPGGPIARMAAGTNPMYTLSFAAPSGVGDVVSFTATATHSVRITERGAACKLTIGHRAEEPSGLSNPGRTEASGSRSYNTKTATFVVTYKGDRPVSFDFIGDSAVRLTGRNTFVCGGKRPAGYDFGSFNVDADFVEPPIPLAFAFSTEAPVAGCTTQNARAGNVQTMTGRCETNESGVRRVTTFKLSWDAPPPPTNDVKVAEAPKFEASTGSITFTQGGKQATWKLSGVMNAGGVMGMSVKVLTYTPDGGTPTEKGTLAVGIMEMSGATTLMSLTVSGGPAGDSQFDAEKGKGKCTVRATGIGGGGKLEASGECQGGFEGALVSKFVLSSGR